jgi:hypothetical protein
MRMKILGSALLFGLCAPAQAVDVTLGASLFSSCILTLNTAGTMTTSSSGTILGSEQSGGTAAVMGVVAIGLFPTIVFTAPSLTTTPAGWTSSHTDEIRYTSILGQNQAYTASSSSHALTGLIDSFTVHGRVTSTAGFAAGNYTLRTTVTCS